MPVGLVSSQAGRLQSEALFYPFQYVPGRNDFLAEAGWCGHDTHDDAALAVDQIVVVISKFGSSALARQSRFRIGS